MGFIPRICPLSSNETSNLHLIVCLVFDVSFLYHRYHAISNTPALSKVTLLQVVVSGGVFTPTISFANIIRFCSFTRVHSVFRAIVSFCTKNSFRNSIWTVIWGIHSKRSISWLLQYPLSYLKKLFIIFAKKIIIFLFILIFHNINNKTLKIKTIFQIPKILIEFFLTILYKNCLRF